MLEPTKPFTTLEIRYVLHKNIDKTLWDRCIDESGTNLVYAQSWYLDCVAPNWNALVINQYDAVMPLPVKRFMGIKTVYQPRFCQQLGVFSKMESNRNVDAFLNTVPKGFLNVCQTFNYKCQPIHYRHLIKNNHILPLDLSYADLFQNYATNTKRNIKKAMQNGLQLDFAVSVGQFLEFKQRNPANDLKPKHFIQLHQLLSRLMARNTANIVGVRNSQLELIGAACLVRYQNRITYLMAVSNDAGKEQHAMFMLIDNVIKQNAETGLILDFEGSMIPGVARFFKGFGAETESYFYYAKRAWSPF